MVKKNSVLVVTIGTRDLAFQLSSGDWLNVGNDQARNQAQDWSVLTHEAQVAIDLETDPNISGSVGSSLRDRTKFLLENFQVFADRLQPIIFGKLLHDRAESLRKIFLIATDQRDTEQNKRFRGKDTLYVAEIIARWVGEKYGIPAEVILLGQDNANPSDFDAMIVWTKEKVWRSLQGELFDIEEILISPKGGVGQLADALRVTALSLYSDKTLLFCDFVEDEESNKKGFPSPYSEPLSQGINYLWELNQKQALMLLDRYDYAGVQEVLAGYLKHPVGGNLPKIKALLQAAGYWNMARFDDFARDLRTAKASGKFRGNLSMLDNDLWIGYEAAYLGWVRYRQGNMTEALFHSFRAVEGTIYDWAVKEFKDDLIFDGNAAPVVKRSIRNRIPNFLITTNGGQPIKLFGTVLTDLLGVANPKINDNRDLQAFINTAKKWRNLMFHRLLGLSKNEVWNAWGTGNQEDWIARVLGCLNFVSGGDVISLESVSLMARVHQELKDAIASYQP